MSTYLSFFLSTGLTILLPSAVVALALLLPAQRLVHIFQLESYKIPQLFLRLKEDRQPQRALTRSWLAAFAAQLLAMAALAFLSYSSITVFIITVCCVFSVIFLAAMLMKYRAWKKLPSKKPLRVTARVVRLDVSLYIVLLLAQIILAAAFTGLIVAVSYILAASGGLQTAAGEATGAYRALTLVVVLTPAICLLLSQLLALLFLPRLLSLAAVIAQPVEDAVKRRYFNEAMRKLEGFHDMIKIGITGSYGKTSCKVILATILAEKYGTYATPHSYNTPMGVTKAVREHLDGGYEAFIAEMGARQPGDIAEMCRLVKPRYGLITSVGPQHLETFRTLENVAKTKYELIEALPEDGMAFFPCDDGICLELYRKTDKPKALFGLGQCQEPLYMTARGIANGPQGSAFTLVGPDGETAPCATKLLGQHNVQNILGCAAVAHALGLTLQEIAAGIGKVQPVEHRLQLIPTDNGVTVIDDAFNSNPAGTRAAMEVLKSFPGRKIVITPGLVELGEEEAAENEAFGRAMAEAADLAILVARNAESMKKGLLAAGFKEENIIVTGRLAQATEALGKISRTGDVVLFENDLPDHYET